MKNITLFLIAISLSILCYPQNSNVRVIEVMDIVKEKPVKIYFDKYCSEVDFIPLRSVEKSPIGIVARIETGKNYIYVLDHKKNLSIYNHDGSFVNRLTARGKGPNEIAHVGLFHLMDEAGKLLIYDDAQRKLMFFDSEGKFIREQKFNFSIDGMSHVDSNTLLFLTDAKYNTTDKPGHILTYIDLISLEVTNKLQLLTSKHMMSSISYIRPKFSRIDGDVILQVAFCDTLFEVTKGSYSSKVVFQLEGTGLKPEMLKDQESRRNVAQYTTQCSTPYETEQFLLFRVDYKGEAKIICQDKNTNIWSLLDAPINQKPGFILRGVDGVTFTPMYCTKNYYYSFIDAIDFKTHFSDIYPKLAASIEEDDNPLIVRGKIK